MILTVTPNAALDRVMFIDEFRPGTSMRPDRWLDKVGGKALDASVALAMFGVDTLALTFVAGSVGQALIGLLDGYGIRHDEIWLAGETRISHVLVETNYRRHSHLTAGSITVPPEAGAELLAKIDRHAPAADWLVAGGTLPAGLPPDFYARLVARAAKHNRPVLLDSSGAPVQAVLESPPAVLKMNWGEFSYTFNAPAGSFEQLVNQARQVRQQYQLPALVLTCGEQGIVAITPAGALHASCPPQPVVNAAGAGDVASAGLAWRLSLGEAWPAALRWTVAASAASVLTEGTADCRLADIEQILPQTTVRPLD
ncbi:MAG: Tagatose-6-phosphate kinase [Anaerolineae bacterium]|nr:Tagatose-6-phosphate kinase [Anaerolineae bacterium]